MKTAALMKKLERTASKLSDGHLSVLKFTTNWRVWFFTPEDRIDIEIMPSGKTFDEAAQAALDLVKQLKSRFAIEGYQCFQRERVRMDLTARK